MRKSVYIINFIYVVVIFVIIFIILRTAEKIQMPPNEEEYTQTENRLDERITLFQDYYLIDEMIGLSGRWFDKEIEGKNVKVTVTAGSMMYFFVEGTTKIDIVFQDMENFTKPYFAYSIDDGDMIRRENSETSIVLPDEAPHIIQIVVDGLDGNDNKWEKEVGLAFERIESYGGTITGVLPKQKRILFVGDSITEGAMIHCFVPLAQNNSVIESFPWKTAEMLNVEPYYIGYSSSGITEKGIFHTTSTMLDYYSMNRLIQENEIPDCDLIVLFVGTNDESADETVFKEGYEEVLLKLHERYPDVSVVCMIPFTQAQNEGIRELANRFSWCCLVETKDWDVIFSDGVHPSPLGTEEIAQNLSRYIIENKLLENE